MKVKAMEHYSSRLKEFPGSLTGRATCFGIGMRDDPSALCLSQSSDEASRSR